MIVFSLGLGLLPVDRHGAAGSSALTQIKYLLLPASALVLVLFGYIARMARAGTIEALDADYTRTAVPQGPAAAHGAPAPRAAQRAPADDHRDRDADRLPDRRARRDRAALQLPGHRPADLRARRSRRTSRCSRRRPRRRRSSTSCTLVADLLYSLLNPRIRSGARSRERRRRPRPRSPGRAVTGALGEPRDDAGRAPGAPPAPAALEDLHRRRDHRRLLGAAARSSAALVPARPVRDEPAQRPGGADARALVRHRPARARRLLARASPGARDILIVAPAATLLGTVLGTALGLVTGYFRGWVDDVLEPARRRLPRAAGDHHRRCSRSSRSGPRRRRSSSSSASSSRPIVARTVRAAVLGERELDYVAGGPAAQRARAVHHVRRDPART